MHNSWEEYKRKFITEQTLEIQDSIGELRLFHYYNDKQLSWMYAIVFNNEILLDTKVRPYEYWNGATAIYKLKYEKHKESTENKGDKL